MLDKRYDNFILVMSHFRLLSGFAFLGEYFLDGIFFKSEDPLDEALLVYHYRKGFKFDLLPFL